MLTLPYIRSTFAPSTERIMWKENVPTQYAVAQTNRAPTLREAGLIGGSQIEVNDFKRRLTGSRNLDGSWTLLDMKQSIRDQLYLIGQAEQYGVMVNAGIPFKIRLNPNVPKWNGLILSKEDPKLRVPAYWGGERLELSPSPPIVISGPNGKILKLNVFDEAHKVKILELPIANYQFQTYDDYPVVRVWAQRFVGAESDELVINHSTNTRCEWIYRTTINGKKSDKIKAKTVGIIPDGQNALGAPIVGELVDLWQQLGGPPDDLLFAPTEEGIKNEDAIFYFQIIAPNVASTTVLPAQYGIRLLEVRHKETGAMLPIPEEVASYYLDPSLDVASALTRLHPGMESDLPPALQQGESIMIINPKTKTPVYHVVPYSQVWRQALLDPTINVIHRYEQLTNARFLSAEDYQQIFPVGLHYKDLTSQRHRLANLAEIFLSSIPHSLRDSLHSIDAFYWEPRGFVNELAYMVAWRGSPENEYPLSKVEQDILRLARGGDAQKIIILLQQTDADQPHIDGDTIHNLAKEHKRIIKLKEKKEGHPVRFRDLVEPQVQMGTQPIIYMPGPNGQMLPYLLVPLQGPHPAMIHPPHPMFHPQQPAVIQPQQVSINVQQKTQPNPAPELNKMIFPVLEKSKSEKVIEKSVEVTPEKSTEKKEEPKPKPFTYASIAALPPKPAPPKEKIDVKIEEQHKPTPQETEEYYDEEEEEYSDEE